MRLGLRFWATAALSLAMTGLAHAGPYYTTPEPLSPYSWAGPYLGGDFGYEWGIVSNNPTKPAGVFAGVAAGYNWQRGSIVFGGETDLQFSGAEDTLAPWQFSNPWYGTLRGRAGVAIGNVLVFGTAGLAYGELRGANASASESHGSLGWVAGGGVEFGFTPHWSAKVEWLYLDLTDQSFAVTGMSNGFAAELLRMGLNYRF
jgi:outer membrane immunogenic protein